jgi:hypothetical protein
MKILDKRLLNLEKSFDAYESDLSHLSDDELDELISEESEALGYRLAKPGEVVEIPEIDRSLFQIEPSAMTDEQLNQFINYGRAKDGYVPIEGID